MVKFINSASDHGSPQCAQPVRKLVGKCSLSSGVDPIDPDTNGMPTFKLGEPLGDRV